MLLDEPLSALDKALRVDMQIELRRIQREVGLTTILVTHDQEEALTLSDRIGILREGRLIQTGSPREVYARPVDRFAATFLGEANIFEGTPQDGGLVLASGLFVPRAEPGDMRAGAIAVRPEALRLAAPHEELPAGHAALDGLVEDVIFAGPTATCLVRHGDRIVKVLVKGGELASVPASSPVRLHWPLAATIWLPT